VNIKPAVRISSVNIIKITEMSRLPAKSASIAMPNERAASLAVCIIVYPIIVTAFEQAIEHVIRMYGSTEKQYFVLFCFQLCFKPAGTTTQELPSTSITLFQQMPAGV